MKRLFAKASKPFVVPKTEAKFTPSSAGNASPHGASVPGAPSLQPKYLVPPIPHPCPYDHLALLASGSGLLIRRHVAHTTPEPLTCVRVSWGKVIRVEEIGEDLQAGDAGWDGAVVVYGIVGILELFSTSHLLVITARTEVGNVIDGAHTIYGVKSVSAIPLVEEQARIKLNTLASRNAQLLRPSLLPVVPKDPESEDDNYTHRDSRGPRVQFSVNDDQVRFITPMEASFPAQDLDLPPLDVPRSSSPLSLSSDISTPSSDISTTPAASVAKALASRLSFWTRIQKRPTHLSTLEMAGSTEHEETQARDPLDTLTPDTKEEPAIVLSRILAAEAPPPPSIEERHSELEEKIVRECIREYTKGGMFFAYNFDITRSLQQKQDQIDRAQKQHDLLLDLDALPSPEGSLPVEGVKTSPMNEPNPTLPLWRRVDRKFWWNEWLLKPFLDAGLHSYILPIMQGYCQISDIMIPPDPLTHDEAVSVDYAIISRRSRNRAGLRYQRRGIDDDANVANFVETETIMRVNRLGVEHVFAFVQIRGSIPLFWTQTGYGLKPPPVLAPDRTHAQNLHALKRHFQRIAPIYGPLTVLNLAEQHGKEGAITQGYREYMRELDSSEAQYHEYDFHTETKGMKYENIAKLIGAMEKTSDTQGFFWISGTTIMSQQKGVFRVNCIDCLDRTNVVQSAFARYILLKQLGAVALHNPQSEGRTAIDIVVNDVWANNGDAISRAYAGTSALKGDFTRTGKRDLGGMLNDGVNSLARMYTSTFSDWFSQAVIDFMLGNRTITVFSEFLLNLQSTDPRDLIRLSKIRAEAIATSISRVLPEGERLLSGWTLFAPEELNTRICDKFEEKVLLLSAQALYIIRFDYTLEKVKLYTRVPLGDVVRIKKGAYILSPLEEASRDPSQNAGFVVTWHNSNETTRVTSYSLRNSPIEVVPDGPREGPIPNDVLGVASLRRLTRSLTRDGNLKMPGLSNILMNAAEASKGGTTFAAFKVLPIDPGRVRMASSGSGGDVGYTEAADELIGAGSCQEAAGMIVECIRRACEDVGCGEGDFVVEEDVVSLAEGERMTSVYAKMEYGVKRLLWLGG